MALIAHVAQDAVVFDRFLEGAVLPEIVSERLLNEDVLAVLDGSHGSREVRVVRRGNQHDVDLIGHLVEHDPEVLEARHVRVGGVGLGGPFVVNIAESDDLFFGGCAHGVTSHAADADDGAADFVARIGRGGDVEAREGQGTDAG